MEVTVTASDATTTFAARPGGASRLLPFLVPLLLALPFGTAAQEGDDAPTTQPRENPGTPEEMIITGERPMYQLREELWSAEQEAYAMFNEFNDEPRFDIHCRMHEPTGTRIRRQVCTPQFQLDATHEHAQNFFYSAGQFVPLETQIASQLQEYRDKMKEVAEENPEFLRAIIRYSEIRSRFEAVREGAELQEDDP